MPHPDSDSEVWDFLFGLSQNARNEIFLFHTLNKDTESKTRPSCNCLASMHNKGSLSLKIDLKAVAHGQDRAVISQAVREHWRQVKRRQT